MAEGGSSQMDGTSRVTGDSHARFCERPGVKFPGPTRRGEPDESRESGHLLGQLTKAAYRPRPRVAVPVAFLWASTGSKEVLIYGRFRKNASATGSIPKAAGPGDRSGLARCN